jgi:zona occludens toxin
MMTVITGVPGAGKTALCVEKLLAPMAGKKEKAIDPDGNHIEIERRIYTNINGLLLDHEKIDEKLLNTWHEWAKPGDLIVYDEVQKPWPLVATGSKKPPHIEALETHRHMGVDFILLTQHPMLIEASVVRLAGRHLHVRKLADSRFATVYEWDGVSRTLLYKNAMAKSPWRRSAKTEKLYRSAALHTKQKRKMPSLVWGALLGVVAVGFFAPVVAERIGARVNPENVSKSEKRAQATDVPTGPQKPASAPVSPASAPLPTSPASTPLPEVAGCASAKGVCRCYTASAKRIQMPDAFCVDQTDPGEVQLGFRTGDVGESQTRVDRDLLADNDVLGWMARRSGRTPW